MKLDTVTLEVIRNALPAVANEMAADLQRTSYNMMIYEVRDYCTALLNTKGELISQNVGGVSHFVADLGVLVTDGMQRYGADGFKPGDVIITNHQAVAGQHLNNVVIYMPYFYKGELLMFLMVRAHWIDVGGTSTGFGAGATVADPVARRAAARPAQDLRGGQAQRAALPRHQGQHPLPGILARRHEIADGGLPPRRRAASTSCSTSTAATRCSPRSTQIFDETERKCRNVVSQLPDGVYEAVGLDRRRRRASRAKRCRSTSRSRSSRGDMTIDLSGCSAERKAAINSRTYAGARVAYKALTGPLDPVNEGSFRALEVIIPEGNIMMARFPAPMAGWSGIVPTVVDTIVMALRQGDAGPRAGRAPRRCSAARWCSSASHPKTKRRFVVQSIEGGGWGGRPFEDGESGTVSVCQGDVRNGSIEGIELKCPVVVESRELRTDSGGAGKYPRRARHRHAGAATWSRATGISRCPRRSKCPPWGIRGGTPGEPGGYLLKRPGETNFTMMGGCHIPVPIGAEAIVRTGGGGGWGQPQDRDPALVAHDVAEGFISAAAARKLYGVVVRGNMSLDEGATGRLRKQAKVALEAKSREEEAR